MKGIKLIGGVLKVDDQNELQYSGEIKPKLRMSAWKDASNFTAIEIREVKDEKGMISLGEEALVTAAFWDTGLTQNLKVGDNVFCVHRIRR